MQVNFINTEQVADLIEQSNVLTTIEAPGNALTYILEYAEQDIIMTVDAVTGEAMVTYPCGSFDAENGGSVHDHARAIMGTGSTGPDSIGT